MASLTKCLEQKVKEGLIDKRQAREIRDAFEGQSNSKSPKQAYDSVRGSLKNSQDAFIQNFVKHANIQRGILDDMAKAKGIKEKINVVRNRLQQANKQGDVEKNNIFKLRDKGLKGGLMSQKAEDVREAITSILDYRKAEGEVPQQIAQNIKDAMRYAKNESDSTGIIFGDLGENYIPRSYNRKKIKAMSDDEFVNSLIDLVDHGGRTRDEMVEFLKQSKVEIETNGRLRKAEETANITEEGFDGTLRSEVEFSRNYSREIHFLDSKSHFKAMELVGNGADSFIEDIDKYFFAMSQDLGLAKIMGPRSRAMVRELQAFVDIDIIKSGGKKFSKEKALLDGEYNVLAGTAFSGDKDNGLYRAFVGSQLWMRSAHLGSAVVSALSDMNFNAMTNVMNGGSYLSSFGDYLGFITNFKRNELKKIAEDMGYYTEIFTGNMLDEARFSISNESDGAMRKLSDFTFKASGLNAWTKVGRIIAQINANNVLSKQIDDKVEWPKLRTVLKDRLLDSGIDEKKWGSLLENANVIDGKRKYINTDDLRAKGNDELYELGDAFDRFVFGMQDLALNENNLTTRAITSGAAFLGREGQAGLTGKALSEAIFQYKNFPLTVTMNHFVPSIKNIERGFKDALDDGLTVDNVMMMSHAITLVLGTGMMAMVPLQLKEILKGRTPKQFETKTFIAALMQGGGAGIFGDFLFQDSSRFGSGPIQTALGPYVATADQVLGVVKGHSTDALINGKGFDATKAGTDILKLMRRNTPVVSSLWYTRLLAERLMFDNLERIINPDFEKKVRRTNRRLGKNNQRSWWGQGENTPDLATN